MKPTSNEYSSATLLAAAHKRLTEMSGKTFITVHPPVEGKTAEGEKLFLFTAHAADDPKGKSFSVAFTSEGKELDPEEFAKRNVIPVDVLEIKSDFLLPFVAASTPVSIS